MSSLSTIRSYELPVWAKSSFTKPPHHGRLQLANLPTPLYQITTNTNNNNRNNNNKNATSSSVLRQKLHQLGCTFWIKRDDATGGVELGGNKIRKLEFLLAEAISTNCDCVVTIGGEQSNHCRATAAASAMLGLAPHLILRCTNQNQNRRTTTTTTTTTEGDIDTIATYDDTNNDRMGTVGNILFDRMVGSHIYTCTVGEYGRMGSQQLVHRVCGHLRTEGKIPYAIPVGGSNGLGSFGYIEAVDEIMKQLSSSISSPVDHICFACGSGGTAAGIAIGMALYHQYYDIAPSKRPHIHAMGVCDDPDYFYTHVTKIAKEMGLVVPTNKNDDDDDSGPTDVEGFIRSSMTVHQCKGLGYAVSTDEELEFLTEFARETGVVLDPVYSGKALYNLSRLLDSNPDQFRGKTILFWHTGGALGLFDKCNHLHLGQKHSPCTKLDVYGKGIGLDVSSSID